MSRTRVILAALFLGCGGGPGPDSDALVELQPPLEHARGAELFARHCEECHGPAASGSDQGPPLVHPVYEPSHHGDIAFQMAVQRGVRAHHWRFGDMPPRPEVSIGEADTITAYVRWLQRQVGIE